ncbi:CBO0543 family protein [Neobacillus kokaensis]|uniref:Rod shape-determining protein MreD n=1 Tax=Neobacillus kokaensis TaxID=2759023 RepID=A0ABQ3MZ29_9BACI|nr:CBO0543 family protein [Neobacillus kokaensis]GHH97934.1 hypothetical protein AM1BK_14770 [Neobacillus kokaensis]
MLLLTVSTIVTLLAVILLPKRIPYLEMYTTYFFTAYLASLADVFLDGKYNLYGFFKKGVDLEYIPIFLIIYPCVSLLIVNFYPFHGSLFRKVIYILIWCAVTLAFEYASLFTGVFYYNGWKFWYSVISYPIIYSLILLNIKVTRKLYAALGKR